MDMDFNFSSADYSFAICRSIVSYHSTDRGGTPTENEFCWLTVAIIIC